MYKKMAALLLAVALLCGCAAHLYRGAKKIRQRVPIE